MAAGGTGGEPGRKAETNPDILAHYRILKKLGKGGMGVVYLAEDLKLGRKLALKLLPPVEEGGEWSETALRRFEREARAASALNHPNILTVYEFGEAGGIQYIATEYVDGVTLRQRMARGRMPVGEALEIAIQVAGALAEAHGAGIVHRDIKPDNVMLTDAGRVKVLDFGLAKVQAVASAGEDGSTLSMTAETREGTIVGSPNYMSPEQALGKDVDARSDIFAFGVLLYEMLSGRQAFGGNSALEVLSGVIHVELPPPSAANPDVGPGLDEFVARCLRKDPAQRTQSMAEVRGELRGLVAASSAVITQTRLSPPRKRHWMLWAGVAAGVVGLAAAGFLVWRHPRPAPPLVRQGPPEPIRVATEGLNLEPAISVDGKFVAYTSDRAGDGFLNLWVKQIGGGDPIRITHEAADDHDPDYSPDGTQIVFRSERDGGGVYIVPTMGGEPRKIASAGRRPRFSPDGKKVAYWTGVANPFPLKPGVGKIFVLDLATGTTLQIGADLSAAVQPVWSPDGKKILFMGTKDAATSHQGWWVASLDGGQAVFNAVETEMIDPSAWLGNWIYYAAIKKQVRNIQRVGINPSSGRLAPAFQGLTASTSGASSPSVSSTGRLVFSVNDTAMNLYTLPLDADAGKAAGRPQLLSQAAALNIAESISADGTRLAFISNRVSHLQVWVRDLATGRESALTEGGLPKASAVISPDGTYVVWRDVLVRNHEDFVAPFAGGAPEKICGNCLEVQTWSRDSKFLLYGQLTTPRSIGLMEFASRKTTPYLKSNDADLNGAWISHDGKWVAFVAVASHNVEDFTVYVAPFAPDRPPAPSEWVKIISSPDVDPNPRWSPDDNLLYFSSGRDSYNCIWAQRLNRLTKHPEGKLFAVEHFHTPSQLLVAPSSKRPWMALARNKMIVSLEERTGGIWMVNLPPDAAGTKK